MLNLREFLIINKQAFARDEDAMIKSVELSRLSKTALTRNKDQFWSYLTSLRHMTQSGENAF